MNHARKIVGLVPIATGLSIVLLLGPNALAANMARILYNFVGGTEADGPYPAQLVMDDEGTLYGSSSYGGGSTNCVNGCGTVYKLTADGQESVLYAFTGGSDGYFPGGLARDQEGNLYGATAFGDTGLGTVFKLAPDGTFQTLHSFAGGTGDGAYPNNVIVDAEGNLYGTTPLGGVGDCTGGCGTVFKITPDGQESIIHFFGGSAADDGAYPPARLTMDGEGNLYGATEAGGLMTPQCSPGGCGTIFRITPDGQESIIHFFGGRRTAAGPGSPLAIDAQGNFYGTTVVGGDKGAGTIFKVTPDGTETVLHSFRRRNDGYYPHYGVILDEEGNVYGISANGGQNNLGIVYRVTPEGEFRVIYDFTQPSVEGEFPGGEPLLDRYGRLLGVNTEGGASGKGTIFAVRK